MSSFEKVRPGIFPLIKKEVQSLEKQGKSNLLFQGCQQSHLFFNQKIAAKDPEKNIPSTEAKATILSPKEALKHKRKQEALLGNRGIYLRIKHCLNLDCSPNKRGFSSRSTSFYNLLFVG